MSEIISVLYDQTTLKEKTNNREIMMLTALFG
jgi:hypothetical protein